MPADNLFDRENGKMHLSESHGCFYQVQTQKHVTNLKWCDFVIWHSQEPFVQQIWYNSVFMKEAFLKTKTYYFERFLPALIPYMIIKFSSVECIPQNHQSMPTTQPYAKDVTVSMSKSSDTHN